MKKKIKYLSLASIVLLIAVLWHSSYQKIEHKKHVDDKIQSLPSLELYTLGGDTMNIRTFENVPTFIIYFNTQCDFCSFEMEEIINHSSDFHNAQVLFVSAEKGKAALDSLNAHFSLDFIGNMGIYQCPYWRLKKRFGEMGTPTVFLYNADRKLKKKFKGATRVSDMINELQSLNDKY